MNDIEGYKKIGKTAFKRLRNDMELYENLKFNLPKFLTTVYKSSGYKGDWFKSSVLSYKYEESDQSNDKNEESKNEISPFENKREEDAIDRLMKNEHIRKNSKIDDYEQQALENIIGSEKIEEPKNPGASLKKSSTQKQKSKKGRKGKAANKKNKTVKNNADEETPKAKNYNTIQEKLPKREKDLDFKEMDIKAQAIEELIEEQTPVPRQEIPTQFEEVLKPSISKFNLNIKPVDSKLISQKNMLKYSILPTEI